MIVQEDRKDVNGPKKTVTGYGAERIEASVENPAKEEQKAPAGPDGDASDEAAGHEVSVRSLFPTLVNAAIEAGRFIPVQSKMEEFGRHCDEYMESHDGAEPDADTILELLNKLGMSELSDALGKALAGIDVAIAVEEMPVIETSGDKPADESDEQEGESDGPTDATDEAADEQEGDKPADDAPAETEEPAVEGGTRKRGRPAKKNVE